MDEIMTTVQGQEQTSDAFLEGWDEDAGTVEQTADQPEDTASDDTKEEPTGADTTTAEDHSQAAGKAEEPAQTPEGSGTESQGEQESRPAADVPKTWTLRHLDENRVVTEQELIALAQKGMDYDRIRSKYDESKPGMELLNQFARQAGMNIPDYIAHLRTQSKRAAGMNEADARRAVELEDREAAVAAKEAEQAERQSADRQKEAADARRRADIAEFQKAFPEAAREPGRIPQEVWADVRAGMTLVTAYSRYAVKEARTRAKEAEVKAEAEKQNAKNAGRSTGSMKSAGGEKKSRDPFLEGWDS